MNKLIMVLSFLFSIHAAAELNTTIIAGVNQNALESALRKKMVVHKVSVVRIEENRLENKALSLIKMIDREMKTEKVYSLSMIIDESFFNSSQHIVKCRITTFTDTDSMLVSDCKSDTSSVENMVFSRSRLN